MCATVITHYYFHNSYHEHSVLYINVLYTINYDNALKVIKINNNNTLK
jgi:hypothetical protein